MDAPEVSGSDSDDRSKNAGPARLIVNPASSRGRAASQVPAVLAELRQVGVDCECEFTRDLVHARALGLAAANAGRLSVAMGGDGLVSAVAAGVADGGGRLAIIPAGSGNDFARALGITSRREAIEALVSEARPVDLGMVNDKPFTCIASVGFDSDVIEIADRTSWVPGTSMTYVYASLRALVRWRPVTFRIESDGKAEQIRGYNAVVANSAAYGGGMWIAPYADLDDGQLDVVVITDISRLALLRALPQVFKGKHIDHPGVRTWRARHVRISTDRPYVVYADGEPAAASPVDISVRQRVLLVHLPGPLPRGSVRK